MDTEALARSWLIWPNRTEEHGYAPGVAGYARHNKNILKGTGTVVRFGLGQRDPAIFYWGGAGAARVSLLLQSPLKSDCVKNSLSWDNRQGSVRFSIQSLL